MPATKQDVLNEFLKAPDSTIRTIADVDALIQKHIGAGGGSYIVFKFIGPDGNYFDLHYNITPEDVYGKRPPSIHTMVKGVWYECGCYLGSDLSIPLVAFCPTCYTHHSPIKKIVNLNGTEIEIPRQKRI